MSSAIAISSRIAVGATVEIHRPGLRIGSMDFVRGMVMILMAIDHVRVYSGVPAGGPTPGVFFTRWITHFVAPGFVFLAGTAAYLHGRKLNNPALLTRFLLIRGAWLILLELTVLRLSWTFNFDFGNYALAGVIWMIGWCMIIMALLARLPISVSAIGGATIIALHNVVDLFRAPLSQAFGQSGPNWFLKIIYFGGVVKLGPLGPPLFILYVIVPWIGVMMVGYAFGVVMEMSPQRRRRVCLLLGAVLTIAFLAIRGVDSYGDPRHWRATQITSSSTVGAAPARQGQDAGISGHAANPQPAMPLPLAFLQTTKYPASLSFLLMTLGPMFLLWALSESIHGRFAGIVTTFGRVPMFYYLLHIPLIHGAACLVSLIREGQINHWLLANHPVAAGPPPPGYVWPLWLLYLVYALCVVGLYFPCLWFAKLRSRRTSRWLSYL